MHIIIALQQNLRAHLVLVHITSHFPIQIHQTPLVSLSQLPMIQKQQFLPLDESQQHFEEIRRRVHFFRPFHVTLQIVQSAEGGVQPFGEIC